MGSLPENPDISVTEVEDEDEVKEIFGIIGSDSIRVFDISLLSGNEEVQPDGTVNLVFEGNVSKSRNHRIRLYHMKEGVLYDMGEFNGGKIEVETDGFSFYVLEFIYDDLAYTVKGESAELDTILRKVGLSVILIGIALLIAVVIWSRKTLRK